MTPQARVQSAIELLDAVIAAARDRGPSADRIVADWFRARRYAGSSDRRAVRELVYAAIRACGPAPVSGRAAMLQLASADRQIAAHFDGSRHGPAPIDPAEAVAVGGLAPAWLEQRLAGSGIAGAAAAALLDRAPLDLRVNALKADRATIDLPVRGTPLPAPQGLRFPHGTPVDQWQAYRAGLVEVQDGGSQLACVAAAARPGETVIDLCAGAGGKTLALAAAMAGQGRLIACDTDRARLARLAPRADRAGAAGVECRLLDPLHEAAALADIAGRADAVLVDAPCSGTGTWRRNPEARWRLRPDELDRYAAVQARLLALAAGLVRPGGRVTFVTCSLLDAEGADQIGRFLAGHPGWVPRDPGLGMGTPRGGGVRLDPLHDGTDGFFIACLSAPC